MADLDFLAEEPKNQAEDNQGGFGLLSIVLLLGVVLIAVIFGVQLARQKQTQPVEGPAPDFTLTTLSGEEITLSDLRGQIVVINFWASWCTPCKDEAADFEAVWQEYQDKGVMILGIAYTDTERNANAYIAEYNQTYPNGLDLQTHISDLYHITGVPETFIIDRDGNIVEFQPISLTKAELSAMLDNHLEEDA